ncbi:MAG: hypothetical protein H7222_17220 [Methylotenera sp.]|nr:hypothetical protein [Oligoflexia bacterium]
MKIQLSKDAVCGIIEIPKGDYLASLGSDNGQIVLVGGGRDFKIPAVRRRANVKTKRTTVTFSGGGGKIWSLVIASPKLGEWISMIQYKD